MSELDAIDDKKKKKKKSWAHSSSMRKPEAHGLRSDIYIYIFKLKLPVKLYNQKR